MLALLRTPLDGSAPARPVPPTPWPNRTHACAALLRSVSHVEPRVARVRGAGSAYRRAHSETVGVPASKPLADALWERDARWRRALSSLRRTGSEPPSRFILGHRALPAAVVTVAARCEPPSRMRSYGPASDLRGMIRGRVIALVRRCRSVTRAQGIPSSRRIRHASRPHGMLRTSGTGHYKHGGKEKGLAMTEATTRFQIMRQHPGSVNQPPASPRRVLYLGHGFGRGGPQRQRGSTRGGHRRARHSPRSRRLRPGARCVVGRRPQPHRL